MTDEQFETEALKLVQCYPHNFPKARMEAIFEEVKDCEAKWWADTVKRIILMGNPKLDIGESARAHRHAKGSEKRAEEIVAATEGIRESGLGNILKQMGANNLLDAIGKRGAT